MLAFLVSNWKVASGVILSQKDMVLDGFGLFWTLPKIAILRGFWNTAISHSLGSKAVRDRLVTGDLDLPFCNPRVHTTSA